MAHGGAARDASKPISTGPLTLSEVTVGDLLLARADDRTTGLVFEDQAWTWAEVVGRCRRTASWLAGLRRDGPFHVGVLLDNVPEFIFLLGAGALRGAVIVAVNPTRRGAGLARDLAQTDCQLLVTESKYRTMLDGLDLPFGSDRIFVADEPGYADRIAAQTSDDNALVRLQPSDLAVLVFTSGTSGDPKAVRCSHRKMASPGRAVRAQFGITEDDVLYVTMPLFHSNSLFMGWSAGVANGATIALRRRFSASGFLTDVRRFGVTTFNYVGKPLSFILATPEQPDDADTTLRLAVGNEAADADIARFANRYGCRVLDGFGSTEGGVGVHRTPDTPAGSIGLPNNGVAVVNQLTGKPCPPARFDDAGRLMNADEAVGEMVNTTGGGLFEGYYNDETANAERLRGGWYWSGDLGYADEHGFFYFAGRTIDWMRVDGENLAAAPIERILQRHPDVVLAAVYAVPAADVGDEVMAALQLRDGARLEPDGFAAFLAAQPDLGTKSAPRYIRISDALPQTPTNKVLKRELARQGLDGGDPIWVRNARALRYETLARA